MIWLRFWLDIWKTRPSKLWGSALWIWSCNTNLYIIAPVHWTVFNWIITKSIYSCYNNNCVGITRVLEQSRLTNDSCLKIVRGTSVKCEMMFGNLNLHWALLYKTSHAYRRWLPEKFEACIVCSLGLCGAVAIVIPNKQHLYWNIW